MLSLSRARARSLSLSLSLARVGVGVDWVCVLPHSSHTYLHEFCPLRDPTYLEHPLSAHSAACGAGRYLKGAVLLPQDLRRHRDVRAVGIPLLDIVPAESAMLRTCALTPNVLNERMVARPCSARPQCCIRSGSTWVQTWAGQVPAQTWAGPARRRCGLKSQCRCAGEAGGDAIRSVGSDTAQGCAPVRTS